VTGGGAALDATHAPGLRSWVESANGHADFPIQNLPFGVFSPPGGGARAGIAIGDRILDLSVLLHIGVLDGLALEAADAACGGARLNDFAALGAGPRRALRQRVSALLADPAWQARVAPALHAAAACRLHVPLAIGDFTDFYAGIHHATHVGRLFRPDHPLLPNYKHVPIGYHGRASSVQVSGTPVRRPWGQRRQAGCDGPAFCPAERLDYELELGAFIGPGNEPGTPIPIGDAGGHIAGYCLLNDWSARDIQAWEYQPLGPFLAKNFATTVSPWMVTPEALAPFRQAQPPRPAGDPKPLPYLWDEADQLEGALGITLRIDLLTPGLRAAGLPPHRVAVSDTRHLYWTFAQLVAHHASGGCNLCPGDLLGSGTISSAEPDGFGSLLEATEGGRTAIRLASGEERRFLEDGDEVIFSAQACRAGAVSIGFGECSAVVLAANKEDSSFFEKKEAKKL
jgi:fumarylacetoacetase